MRSTIILCLAFLAVASASRELSSSKIKPQTTCAGTNKKACSNGLGGTVCANIISNRDHCGGCGLACPAGYKCYGMLGEKVCFCGEKHNYCGDSLNVNAALTGVCTADRCVCSAADETQCGISTDANGGCVNTDTDPKNCGACGISCLNADGTAKATLAGTCTDGHCDCALQAYDTQNGPAADEVETLTSCSAFFCADTKADEANCGSCGNVCGATESCVGGVCSCDPAKSEAPCPCVPECGDSQTCNDGTCVCDPTKCASGACDGSGACTPVDPCASVVCAAHETCSAGTCACDGTKCASGACNGSGACTPVDLCAGVVCDDVSQTCNSATGVCE